MRVDLRFLAGLLRRLRPLHHNGIIAGALAALALVFLGVGSGHAANLYCTGGDGTQLVTVDQSNAASVVIGPSASGAYAAAFAPNGTLYGIMNWASASDRLVTYNLATGAVTPVGGLFGVEMMLALEIAGNGICYGGSWGTTSNFFSINLATGAPTLIGSTGFDGVMDFAFDSQGVLWAVNNFDLWTIDTSTGASTHKAAITGTGPVMGIMFDALDVLYATDYTPSSSLYTINTSTGAATLVGNTGLSFAHGGDFLTGGPTPTQATTWGEIKVKYRR